MGMFKKFSIYLQEYRLNLALKLARVWVPPPPRDRPALLGAERDLGRGLPAMGVAWK